MSKPVKSASLEAAGSSTCGGGWAPSGWGLTLGVPSCPEPPGAPWEGTAGELEHCEDGHFDGAAEQILGRVMKGATAEDLLASLHVALSAIEPDAHLEPVRPAKAHELTLDAARLPLHYRYITVTLPP